MLPVNDSRGSALVTGGTGKVGRVLAERLEEAGFRVFAAGRADGDLATAAGARGLVEQAASDLGGLDLVVHAASAGFEPRRVADVTEEHWDEALGATAKGAFFVAQTAAPHLAHSPLGLLVLVEDVAGYDPWPLFAPHTAAKAAEGMLTRVLARALAPVCRVCGVAPGAVAVVAGQEERRAAETLHGRIGSPDDVAGAVLYLVDAPFVTGTTIVVDGGRMLHRQTGGA